MKAGTLLLREVDDAWNHRWESLEPSLDGITARIASWQHPAYANEETEKGWPKPGTIHWLVAHIHFCKLHYIACLKRRSTRISAPKRKPAKSVAAEIAALKNTQRGYRAAIAALSEKDLDGAIDSQPLAVFLHAIIRHDVWHAAQIRTLKRLAQHDLTRKKRK